MILFIVLISIKQINQYQKGIKFLLGKDHSQLEIGGAHAYRVTNSKSIILR
jgi:hypothetical protein